jgi:hypothetical protein
MISDTVIRWLLAVPMPAKGNDSSRYGPEFCSG